MTPSANIASCLERRQMRVTAPIMQSMWVPQYQANSMARDSPQMKRIQAAVKKAGMFIVLGYSERDGASIYLAQAFISPDGEIVLNRRKIKPTHAERTIWGEGQAESLQTVVDSPFGKIGGLNCWEHLQPLLRYYEFTQGVQIHVSSWPSMFVMPDPEKIAWLYHDTGEADQRISQNMAMEGQVFVICSSQILTEEGLAKNSLLAGNPVTKVVCLALCLIYKRHTLTIISSLAAASLKSSAPTEGHCANRSAMAKRQSSRPTYL